MVNNSNQIDHESTTQRRIALIGHSASGKSSCLCDLQPNPADADMDSVLGTTHCPTLQQALAWLDQDDQTLQFVAVSNHEETLKALNQARQRGEYATQFERLRLVYLRKDKNLLRKHLMMPTSGGTHRPQAHIKYTLENYERFDCLFRELADEVVECADRPVSEIVNEIRKSANS